jgi:biopolymer transport protein ExbB/TolQ
LLKTLTVRLSDIYRPERKSIGANPVKTRHSTTATTAILAIVGTLSFYAFAYVAPAVPGLTRVGAFVRRYFCEHPLEYISTAMFFTGIAILLQKFRTLRDERSALRLATDAVADPSINVWEQTTREAILHDWCTSHQSLERTQVHVRIQDVLQYMHGSGRTGLEEHLRYLAELGSERLHQTFATIRTITWAIPILGFLGTVIGITMAIANVTPEQLDTSLVEVTGGLSVAFDTTALALGMSIVLVFGSFSVERSEQQVQNDVEQFGIETLLPWFGEAGASGIRSTTEGGVTANFAALQQEMWTEQLAQLKTTWGDLLQGHAHSMKEALDAEVSHALKLHRDHSADARDAYTTALQQSSHVVVQQTEVLLATFEERIVTWQDAMMVSSQNSARQSEALHDLGATLLKMTESEERLIQLQKLLTDNLQALHVADTMEQTASSLTAAVHILTARTSARRAA